MLKKYGRLIWLFLILIVGFAGTTGASFFISQNTLTHSLAEQSLPALSDNLAAEFQSAFSRPQAVSQLANNAFARDWLTNGEEDTEQLSQFLKEIKNKHNAQESVVVSEQSRRLHNSAGAIKTLSITEPHDNWYFQFRNLKAPYEIRLDADPLNHEVMSIAINYKLASANGKFLGIIGLSGISINTDRLKTMIDTYQDHFQTTIYFVDKQGEIVLSGTRATSRSDNLNAIDGLKNIASNIVSNKKNTPLALEYQLDASKHLVNIRSLPDLGWQLVIDKNLDEVLKPQVSTLFFNLAVGLILTLTLTIIAFFTIRKYEAKLEKSATTDTLTNLLNRHAFDFVFQQSLLDAGRSRQPMCVLLLDIDFFKKINDKQGRQVGDHVLREIAAISKRSLRESDVICRWGGEEFLILLKNCTLEKATSIAENLRSTIAANDFSRTTDLTRTRLSITVSMGVAECRESETEDSVFDRADEALAQAKKNGRNSVYFSE
ncbi:sensor domain-containing diguanylate cyclase [Undibacterium sp. RuRC25W]|uniref:sensor domain-containing diguanylate cyclase n=1 Tax=Undibacterium sp. RuRC25W TaxID=3413047 RepID=UPI003BF3BF7A